MKNSGLQKKKHNKNPINKRKSILFCKKKNIIKIQLIKEKV